MTCQTSQGDSNPKTPTTSTESTTAAEQYPEGVYRSESDGHLFVMKKHPVRMTCVICMETCDTSQHKNFRNLVDVVKAFTDKHGYLGDRIADSLLQLIPTANEPKQ